MNEKKSNICAVCKHELELDVWKREPSNGLQGDIIHVFSYFCPECGIKYKNIWQKTHFEGLVKK